MPSVERIDRMKQRRSDGMNYYKMEIVGLELTDRNTEKGGINLRFEFEGSIRIRICIREGESKSRDYAAASSYYLQATSLWPSRGNPHHQLAIMATYSGDELMEVYRYFRSLAVQNPFATARDNLIVSFVKNRQRCTQLHADPKAPSVKESHVRTRGKGRGKAESGVQSKEPIIDASTDVDKIRQMFKAFRVYFVRLNGILFTRTSLETFEKLLSAVSNVLHELLSSRLEEEPSFGTDSVENGLSL